MPSRRLLPGLAAALAVLALGAGGGAGGGIQPPINVAVAVQYHAFPKISLTWQPGAGDPAAQFEIWWLDNNAGGGFSHKTTVLGARRVYSEVALDSRLNWSYYLVAVDAAGNKSAASPTVTVTAPAGGGPALGGGGGGGGGGPPPPVSPPANVRALARYGPAPSITVTWAAGAGGAPAVSYEVQRSAIPGGAFAAVATINLPAALSHADSAITTADDYLYQVVAIDAAGNRSPPSVPRRMNIRTVWPTPTTHQILHNFDETIGTAAVGGPAVNIVTGFHAGVDIQKSGASNEIVAPRSGVLQGVGGASQDDYGVNVAVDVGGGRQEVDTFNHLWGNGAFQAVGQWAGAAGDPVFAGQRLGYIGLVHFAGDVQDHTHFGVFNPTLWEHFDQHTLSYFPNAADRDPNGRPPAIDRRAGPGATPWFYFLDQSTGAATASNTVVGGSVDIAVRLNDAMGTNPGNMPAWAGYWIEGLRPAAPEGDLDNVRGPASPYLLFDHRSWFFGTCPGAAPVYRWQTVVDPAQDLGNGNTIATYNWDNFKHYLLTNCKGTRGDPAELDPAGCWNTNAKDDGTDEFSASANYAGKATTTRAHEARFPDGQYRIHVVLGDLVHAASESLPLVRLENFAPIVTGVEAWQDADGKDDTPKEGPHKGFERRVYAWKWQRGDGIPADPLKPSGDVEKAEAGKEARPIWIWIKFSEGMDSGWGDTRLDLDPEGKDAGHAPVSAGWSWETTDTSNDTWTATYPLKKEDVIDPAGTDKDELDLVLSIKARDPADAAGASRGLDKNWDGTPEADSIDNRHTLVIKLLKEEGEAVVKATRAIPAEQETGKTEDFEIDLDVSKVKDGEKVGLEFFHRLTGPGEFSQEWSDKTEQGNGAYAHKTARGIPKGAKGGTYTYEFDLKVGDARKMEKAGTATFQVKPPPVKVEVSSSTVTTPGSPVREDQPVELKSVVAVSGLGDDEKADLEFEHRLDGPEGFTTVIPEARSVGNGSADFSTSYTLPDTAVRGTYSYLGAARVADGGWSVAPAKATFEYRPRLIKMGPATATPDEAHPGDKVKIAGEYSIRGLPAGASVAVKQALKVDGKEVFAPAEISRTTGGPYAVAWEIAIIPTYPPGEHEAEIEITSAGEEPGSAKVKFKVGNVHLARAEARPRLVLLPGKVDVKMAYCVYNPGSTANLDVFERHELPPLATKENKTAHPHGACPPPPYDSIPASFDLPLGHPAGKNAYKGTVGVVGQPGEWKTVDVWAARADVDRVTTSETPAGEPVIAAFPPKKPFHIVLFVNLDCPGGLPAGEKLPARAEFKLKAPNGKEGMRKATLPGDGLKVGMNRIAYHVPTGVPDKPELRGTWYVEAEAFAKDASGERSIGKATTSFRISPIEIRQFFTVADATSEVQHTAFMNEETFYFRTEFAVPEELRKANPTALVQVFAAPPTGGSRPLKKIPVSLETPGPKGTFVAIHTARTSAKTPKGLWSARAVVEVGKEKAEARTWFSLSLLKLTRFSVSNAKGGGTKFRRNDTMNVLAEYEVGEGMDAVAPGAKVVCQMRLTDPTGRRYRLPEDQQAATAGSHRVSHSIKITSEHQKGNWYAEILLKVDKKPEIRARDRRDFSILVSFEDVLEDLKAKGLDLVFVIDSTGSMGGAIDGAKKNLQAMVNFFEEIIPEFRLGIATYRDRGKEEKYLVRSQGLTASRKTATSFLWSLKADGGGDTPEAVEAGLYVATRMGFRGDAKKVVILVGDAPPHPKDQGRAESIAAAFKASGGVVSCIEMGGSKESFARIARAGGGECVPLGSNRAILQRVVLLTFGTEWAKDIDRLRKEIADRKKAAAAGGAPGAPPGKAPPGPPPGPKLGP